MMSYLMHQTCLADALMLDKTKKKYGIDAVENMELLDNKWKCACGKPNNIDDEQCSLCRRKKMLDRSISWPEVLEHMDTLNNSVEILEYLTTINED